MEIHSVRVRKKESNGLESYGLSDIKISVDNSFPGEDGFGSNITSNNNESGPNGLSSKRTITGYDSQNTSKIVWSSIKYEGDRYINLNNTQLITEYVRMNSLLFADNYGYEGSDAGSLYEVVQDPWNINAPLIRRFGYDPYYFNNNSKAYIRWFYYPKIGYEFGSYELFSNGTSSPPTDIVVNVVPLIDGEEDVDYPKFELYFSPSNYNLTSSVNYIINQATTTGLVDSDGRQYPKDGTVLSGDDYIRYEGGGIYSDQNLNEINTPSTIKKRVDIVSPEISDGVNIEQTFIITSDNTLSYPGEKITPKNWDYKVKDTQILQEIVNLWKKKVPDYDFKLSSPDYQSPTSSLQYKSPFGTASKPDDKKGPSSSTTPSIKLNVVFPSEFNPIVRETLKQFSVWIGEPQLDDPVDGFIFQDDNTNLEVSSEYTESQFNAEEESPENISDVNLSDDFITDVSSVQRFDSTSTSTSTSIPSKTVVSLPKNYSHTTEQGYNILDSKWIGDLITSAKSHIGHPTYDISGTDKGALGCASAVSMMFYRAFGVHMKTGQAVNPKPTDIGSFGTKGTSEAAGWFENTTLYKKIDWKEAQPGDIMNTARNFSTEKAGHIGVVIDEKDPDGSWAIISNSSKGFAGGGGGAVKQNYSVKQWQSVATRNPSQTFAFRYIGPKLNPGQTS